MSKKISRKVLPMLAVMALAFALAGCGGTVTGNLPYNVRRGNNIED